ncbi:MAG: transketolase family protein [candidate division WOR-3 bacterium]
MRYMRDAVGEVLCELGERDERVVVLDADLGHSTRAAAFGDRFPDRYFQMGIAEQNMVGVAAGLAAEGKIPFVSTFAIFGARAWEQVRLSVAYSGLPVKFIFTHAGLATGPDGASHQMTEDISLMASVPGMTVFSPSDYASAKWALREAYTSPGPAYVRMTRPKGPDVYPEDHPFAPTIIHGEPADLAIISTGLLTPVALEAQRLLASRGVLSTLYDVLRIKPLEALWLSEGHRAVLVVEDHVRHGGLFSLVAQSLVELGLPVLVRSINMGDGFGESGETGELYEKYGFAPENLARLAEEAIKG